MGLQEYRLKRRFKDTPEPEDTLDASNKSRFVVQRHRASHLHYDLRLEMDGVLKSWAVPKGPSMNPHDKRLAVQTEDHPVAYLSFEGVIPKGNYGAGKMTIWDSGHYTNLYPDKDLSQDHREGKLKIIFHGHKLKGLFTLVRSSTMNKENQWLLIKHGDDFATNLNYNAEDYTLEDFSNTSPKSKEDTITTLNLKSFIKPMLASPGTTIFNDKNWIYELKYDGYRALAHIEDGQVELYTRNGISLNKTFAPIHEALESMEHRCILDGEIVVLDDDGLPQFSALQKYNEKTTQGHLMYYVFDLLHLNGHDILELPLTDRKELLKSLISEASHIAYCDHVVGMGITVYHKAIEMGMEGVIAKKADSTYDPNTRSTHWLKFKKIEDTEAIICGYTVSKTPSRKFASLILGMVEDGQLKYVGTCGSGFSEALITELYHKFEVLKTDKPVFDIGKHLKGREPVWLAPQLVCEVKFSEWTPSKIMRHPIFLRLREDKAMEFEAIKPTKSSTVHKTKDSEFTLEVDQVTLYITNPDKIYWPKSRYTKYDMLDYYIQMSEFIVPYLVDRPQSLHRHPNGIDGSSFYQKDHEHLPNWIETHEVPSKSTGKVVNYMLSQNQASLLYMNNLGCIELHPWHSTIYNLDHPDYAIIDLDPSEANTFDQVIETALVTKDILDLAGIEGYCKTSGASGLHIYLPMGGQYAYKEARDFTKLICYYILERLPKLTTMERSLKNRGPKIYLDYLQNRKGQTIAAPYSLRPQEQAPVSMPLKWSEVKKGLKITDFTMKSVPDLISKRKDIFKPILGQGIAMEKAIEKLNEL